MSEYQFCVDCEHIRTKMVPGLNGLRVKELSCPARFNPREGKWVPKDGKNPYECPRNESFIILQKQSGGRKLR